MENLLHKQRMSIVDAAQTMQYIGG